MTLSTKDCEGRGRAVGAECSGDARLAIVEWGYVAVWGEPLSDATTRWVVDVVSANGRVVTSRSYPRRVDALALALALFAWLDVNRRRPTLSEVDALEEEGPVVVRERDVPGARVEGVAVRHFDNSTVEAVCAASRVRRLLPSSSYCLDDEDDRDRVALEVARAIANSPDAVCVREGLGMLARGERLTGWRWVSWLDAVARLALLGGVDEVGK